MNTPRRKFRYDDTFPHEAFVQRALEQHFVGATPAQRAQVDLAVVIPGTNQQWVIEAKGETSDPGLDFRTCLGQILTAMCGDGAWYGVALPATNVYRRLCGGISDHVRQALQLHWLLVDGQGKVWVVSPDEPLPDGPFMQASVTP
jgi:hypothetical protein